MYNLLIGGAAGQGIDTTAAILEKSLKKSGYFVLTVRDFMSRIRGGHNFSLIRFGTEEITSHSFKLDGIIALNDETVDIHLNGLKPEGFILGDSKLATEDSRAIKYDIEAMAKRIGNSRVAGVIAVGSVLKIFGEGLEYANEILRLTIKSEFIEMNLRALWEGYEAVRTKFSHFDGHFADYMTVTGSEAISLGALAAGMKFYTGYPMSPSTAVLQYLAGKSKEIGIVVEQAEDEIAAINMALGASYAGAKAMTGSSGGGFSLMVEALGFSGIAEIPIVILEAQRPGPATGLPTRTEQADLRFVISASQGEFPRLVISLKNQQDAYYQTIRAFYLAEKYQIPVILLSDQYLGDSSATIKKFSTENIQRIYPSDMKEIAGEYLRYRLTDNGISQRMIPGKTMNFVNIDSDEHSEIGWITESAHMRRAMVDKRMKKLEGIKTELQEPEFLGEETFDALLVAWGSLYGPVKEAVNSLNEREGKRFAALVFGDVFPMPTTRLIEKCAMTDNIINVEQNATGQLAGLIREHSGIKCKNSILKYDGRQMTGEEIVDRISEASL